MNSASKYNPLIHHRRSIRLKGYDYSAEGLYFITICIHNRQCLFGEIVNNEMQLNEYGMAAYDQWQKIHERFATIELDVFQIMPNHMHGIIAVGATLAGTVGAGPAPAPDINAVLPDINQVTGVNQKRAGASPAPTVGDIIGAYKSLVANECLQFHKQKWAGVNPPPYMGKLWQRNYYEHIIRNETALTKIRDYIINNPFQWNEDKFNPVSNKK